MLLAGRRGGRRGGQDCGRERRRRSRRRGGGRKRPQVQFLERNRRRCHRRSASGAPSGHASPRLSASGATLGHRSAWGSSQQTWASPQHTQGSRSSRSCMGTRTRRHLCRKLDPKGQADWPERQAGRNKCQPRPPLALLTPACRHSGRAFCVWPFVIDTGRRRHPHRRTRHPP